MQASNQMRSLDQTVLNFDQMHSIVKGINKNIAGSLNKSFSEAVATATATVTATAVVAASASSTNNKTFILIFYGSAMLAILEIWIFYG